MTEGGVIPRPEERSIPVHLERRSLSGQLRYLAGKLGDDPVSVSVMLALEVIADDLDSSSEGDVKPP